MRLLSKGRVELQKLAFRDGRFQSRNSGKIGSIAFPRHLLHRDVVVGSGDALKKGHGGLVKGKRVDKVL